MVERGGKSSNEYIRWLSELNKNSGPVAGGKGANLAEMFNAKFPVPPAFVVTTKGYYAFIEKSGIKDELYRILDSIDVDDTLDLEAKAKKIRELIISAEMPDDMATEITEAYENLSIDKQALEKASKYALSILKNSNEPVFIAVRSSATTEDLDDSSFAGQQESYLNIKGNKQLIESVKKVLASLFTARAIYYRKKRGFSKEKFALAVVVQKMIDSDKSGVIFSSNPVKENNDVMIEAVWGLGEGIVSGKINPDNYIVSRELKLLEKKISEKKIAIVRDSQGDTSEVKLSPTRSKDQVLEESEIKSLANYALRLEEHYGKPQDIEFSIESREIYIIQTRPITTQAKKGGEEIKGELLLSGLGASQGVASGTVRIIKDLTQLDRVQKGDVLVTEMTNPDMVITMQRSAAIITDEGGITSHAAIVSREMGIPAVVGTGEATKKLVDGQIVTVDGFNGKVYEGATETKLVEIKPVIETKTKIKVIVDLPAFAERAALTKCSAVGLLRLEGIIASSGKHPIAYQKEDKLSEYSKVLEQGISKIAEHFQEVWIRTSDIRTDEFSNLEGAPKKIELNPMLGMHGVRFSLKNPEILKAELEAVRLSSQKYPDKIFGIMLPQIISAEEVKESKKLVDAAGIKNYKFGIMVETPAACLIIKDLIKVGIDFASLGTNDLTQYTLAIDRGNELVQYLYNETNPAVLNAIKRVIRTCNEEGVESSICGQAGSNSDMVKFLVENKISSISVNADAAHDVSVLVAELEKNQSKDEETAIEVKAKPLVEIKQEEIKEEKFVETEDVTVEEAPKTEGIEGKKEELEKKVEEEEEQRGYENHVPAYTASSDEATPEERSAMHQLFGEFDELEEIKEYDAPIVEEIEENQAESLEEITEEEGNKVLDIF
ncbi:MAG: phosphoenolpyruvate synthase [Candidatus Pacearchaeota archaeon]|jgi:pyruvate,water dikinase